MSLDTARSNIVAAVQAALVGIPGGMPIVEYDNRVIVNTQTQTAPYLQINVVFFDGWQADLSESPIQRVLGQLHIIAVAKEGDGSAACLKMLDHLYPQLQRKALGIVRTETAKPLRAKDHLGWCGHPVIIPFRFDKIY